MQLRRWLLPLLLLLLAVGGLAYLRFMREAEVTAIPVRRGTAAEIVYANGVVEPRYWAKVSTLLRKRIVEICDCEGDAVKRGDVLARLDDTEERATLAEMQARRALIEDDVRRAKALLEKKVTAQTAYDQVVTQLKEYDARIAAQQQRIDDLVLRSPMDGVVLRRDGEVGEIATTSGDPVLFWIGEMRPLRVVADVNEEDIPRVEPGQKVLLRSEGFKDRVLSAEVADITPKGDSINKTFRVYLSLPDDTPLSIGMSVEANIVVEEHADALLVPGEAVLDGAVFKVVGGRVIRTPVKIGLRGTRMVEVLDGLAAGDLVASPAFSALRDGARVREKAP